MFTRLVIEARFLRLYRCSKCGSEAQGTTERVELDVQAVQSYTLDSRVIPQKAVDMPVGWASYYGSDFRCPKCQ